MPRPIRALIDHAALAHNLSVLRQKAGTRFFWAVVKADAYGHGLCELLAVFDKGADGLALLDIHCAVEARQNGWKKPILLIEGIFSAEDLTAADRYDLETVIHNERQMGWLKEYKGSRPLRIHIKCNTGMNRLGFRPQEIPSVLKRLSEIPKVQICDLVAHFANSEVSYPLENPVSVDRQLAELNALRGRLPMCLSNTGAILWHPKADDISVRAGIAMYGVSPDSTVSSESLGLVPVMTLESEILAVQHLEKGDAVGYGSLYEAQCKRRIAIVACGYADGYPRGRWEGVREVFVEGKKAPIIGNVSMDMIAIDVTAIAAAQPGSKVEFWGKNIPVNETASHFGTIGYELLCDVNKRVPRVAVNADF